MRPVASSDRPSDDVEQVKQDDDRDRDPEQPQQNAFTHGGLLTGDENLFLAGDLAYRILGVADRALHSAFGLIGLAFGFGLGITDGSAKDADTAEVVRAVADLAGPRGTFLAGASFTATALVAFVLLRGRIGVPLAGIER